VTRLACLTAAQVTPQRATFAWEGRVPIGAPTILAGQPGLGKTQLAIGVCARATRGTLQGDLHGEPSQVLYVSAEDSLEHTLVPRFLAAGGDPHRIHFFQHKQKSTRNGEEQDPSIQLPDDIPVVDEWLKRSGARLVVLDPIVALIPPSLNAHRDQHVRRAIAPLARMADERHVAVLAIMHLNKDREAGALNRLSGSIGFGAAARSVLIFGSDPDDPEGETGNQRILAHAKCNVARLAPSVAYRIESRTVDTAEGIIETSVAVRHGDTRASASDLLGNATGTGEATARTEAREFLTAELADGPVAVNDLKKHAEDAGVAWRTVERAKTQVAVRSRKTATHWTWEIVTPNTPPGGLDVVGGLEPKAANNANNATEGNVALFEAEAELDRLATKYPDLTDQPTIEAHAPKELAPQRAVLADADRSTR